MPGAAWDACQSGTYCKPTADWDGAFECPDFPSINGEAGLCALPQREGTSCDANWGSPGCRVCEPGTGCLPDPDRGGALTCQRPCEDDLDCPCPGTGEASVCRETGFCSICIVHGSHCEFRVEDSSQTGNPVWEAMAPYGCCDEDDECDPVGSPTLEPGAVVDGICCREEGAPCEVGGGDCCGNDACDPATNECVACGQFNEPIPTLNGEDFCCDGLEPRDDLCLVPCQHTSGACEKCPNVTGTWSCTPTGSECEPPGGAAAFDDCDGIDNDCDEKIDEDWEPPSATCTAEDADCGDVEGTWDCSRSAGGEVCLPDTSGLCKYTFGFPDSFRGNAAACGWGYLTCSTTGVPGCPPTSWCESDNCSGVQHCFPVDQKMCSQPNADDYLPPRSTACTGDTICWEPGQLGGFTGCP